MENNCHLKTFMELSVTNLGSFEKELDGLNKHKTLVNNIFCKHSPLFMFLDPLLGSVDFLSYVFLRA